MANEQNLIPNSERSSEEVRKNSRKGGINSGKKRREKKTIQKLLNDFLSTSCNDFPQFEKLAEKIGIETKKSKKELFTIVCVMNTLKKGTIDDLAKLVDILGENNIGNNEKSAIDEIAKKLFKDD